MLYNAATCMFEFHIAVIKFFPYTDNENDEYTLLSSLSLKQWEDLVPINHDWKALFDGVIIQHFESKGCWQFEMHLKRCSDVIGTSIRML